MSGLTKAAREVLRAVDAYRDALNGKGHEGEQHDTVLLHSLPGDIQIFDTVGDCSACVGAQMGAEADLYQGYGSLREALGEARLPWEIAS